MPGGADKPRPPPEPRVDVGRLAHELRTPLGAIQALAEIIRDERLGPLGNPRYRAYAADIHLSASHANAVLGAFLDPSACSVDGTGPFVFAELDMAALVPAGVSALEAIAVRSGVALDVVVPEGLPRVIADRRSVLQILNNLVSNALRFTPPGGRVRIALTYAPGGPVVLEIADTGDGMDAAALERLNRSLDGRGALSRRSGSSGIGIPLVRSLAAAGGADVGIESSLGHGTRVRVAFGHDRVVPV